MGVSPLDIQTIIAQTTNVAKAEQSIMQNPINAQEASAHHIEQEHNKMEEQVIASKESEGDGVPISEEYDREKKKREYKYQPATKRQNQDMEENHHKRAKEPGKGNIIDILR